MLQPTPCTLLSCLVLLAACTGEPAAADLVGDDEASIVVETLSATIGATGGTLEGEVGGPFEGFRMVIPPGAVLEDTEFSVTGVVDPTPLAPDAERVGPQFALGPDGLDLLLPASVTVPFDPSLRSSWQNEDEECRVWLRDGDGWFNEAQTASTSDGVTVPVSTLTTLAAGVSLVQIPTNCALLGTCPTPTGASGCLDGSSYCLTRLSPPKVAAYEYTAVSVHDGNAYFVTSPGQNSFAVAEYDLFSTTGATRVTTPLTAVPTRSVSARGRITPDPASNDLWVSLQGYGNVRFRFGSVPARFDTATDLSPTGIADASGTFLRYVIANTGSGRSLQGILPSGKMDPAIAITTSDTPTNVLPVRPDGAFSKARILSFLAFASNASGVRAQVPNVTTKFTDVCGSSNTLVSAFDATYKLYAVGCLDRTLKRSNAGTVSPGHTIGDLAIGTDERVYVIDPSVAQITRVERGGGVSYIPLTSAAPGTADHSRMLPRAIRYDDSLDMLVLFTRGNNSGGIPDVFLVDHLD